MNLWAAFRHAFNKSYKKNNGFPKFKSRKARNSYTTNNQRGTVAIIDDNGYGMFLNMLEYKLADRGKYFVKIDKWFPSSQLCSCCGSRKKLELSERKYICTCGLEINRDLNAAINIKNEGLRLLEVA